MTLSDLVKLDASHQAWQVHFRRFCACMLIRKFGMLTYLNRWYVWGISHASSAGGGDPVLPNFGDLRRTPIPVDPERSSSTERLEKKKCFYCQTCSCNYGDAAPALQNFGISTTPTWHRATRFYKVNKLCTGTGYNFLEGSPRPRAYRRGLRGAKIFVTNYAPVFWPRRMLSANEWCGETIGLLDLDNNCQTPTYIHQVPLVLV